MRRQAFQRTTCGKRLACCCVWLLATAVYGQDVADVEVLRAGDPAMELHRVTIHGVAVNDLGEPVGGAEIFVASTNSRYPSDFDRLRGRTRTSPTGKFTIENVSILVLRPGDPKQRAEGALTVFGVQRDYGFVWSDTLKYRPSRRPEGNEEQAFYEGERIEVPLTFELGSRLLGRITDDRGKPLAGVKVQVGYIDNVRNPQSSGMFRCEFLGSEALPNVKPSEFGAIALLPAPYRETRTDADGRYELRYLRRNCSYLGMIDPGVQYTPHRFELRTTGEGAGRGRTVMIGDSGELDWSFLRPQSVKVRVVTEDNAPVADASVIVRPSRELRRVREPHRTDATGHARFELQPGVYELAIAASPTEPLLSKLVPLDIQDSDVEQSVSLAAAAKVTMATIDASGQRRVGVAIVVQSSEDQPWKPLHSHPTLADYPVSDTDGRLMAIMQPGRYRFAEALSDSTQPPMAPTPWIDIAAAESVDIKVPVSTDPPEPPMSSGSLPESTIRAARRQKALLETSSVRVSLRRTFTIGPSDFSRAELRAILAETDGRELPDLAELARRVTGRKQLPRTILVTRGRQRRADHFAAGTEVWPNKSPDNALLFNGSEGVRFDTGNSQAELYRARDFRYGMQTTRDLAQWAVGFRADADGPQPTVERQGDDLIVKLKDRGTEYTQRVDANNGFVYSTTLNSEGREIVSRYYAPKSYAGGLMLAGGVAEWRVANGKVERMEIMIVDDVKVADLPPGAFSIACPPGTLVLDHRVPAGQRQGAVRARTTMLRHPVLDLVAFLGNSH